MADAPPVGENSVLAEEPQPTGAEQSTVSNASETGIEARDITIKVTSIAQGLKRSFGHGDVHTIPTWRRGLALQLLAAGE